MWENGKKEIPYKRKQQLSQFFGIEEGFFGEITEEEKQVLLDKAMLVIKAEQRMRIDIYQKMKMRDR